ncbi:hypothetical protein [Burkholderia ubonensis]|uniref:hypothetical protein n=1 Tax=Burkholderia ubonensis TaxID=101571 RepID=UPI00075E81BC|nr:hypothetical protein [Burkholderia ubonensis]KWN63603.1 hypothetical protein WM23_12645 [Burkholderia ubonensis]
MNDAIPEITYLPGPAPIGTHLTADELARHSDASLVIDAAQTKACKIIEEANDVLAAAHQEVMRIREVAYQQGIASAAAELERQRVVLIDETVQWLIDESTAEARIAQRLDAHIRTLIASVVKPYLGECDAVELLTQRVLTRLTSDLSSGIFSVYVAPVAVERIQVALCADRRARVLADPTLVDTQARLETPDAIVQFDLDQHLNALLLRLTTPSPETLAHAQSN